MGLFWDLIQQSQISDQGRRSDNLEQRVYDLERELRSTQNLLKKTLEVLEEYTNRDIDGDGRIGR